MTKKISKERIRKIQQFLEKLNITEYLSSENSKEEVSHYLVLDEALTHTSAQRHVNHECLEFLGDAVLRLAATEFIEKNFPKMNVGERSELRAQLVSDKWLSEIGQQIAIREILITGIKASKDFAAIATLEAEATEALIGALYTCVKQIDPIHKWLKPYWIKTSQNILADPHKNNPKSALQEWSQAKGFSLPLYQNLEQNKIHGDPERFLSQVHLDGKLIGEGLGGSRQEAEKAAARFALQNISSIPKS